MKETDLNTVRFTFSVLDDGLPCDLTDTTVQLTVKKPSTMTIVQDCTITDAVNGMCEVILPNQAYIEVGNHSGELVITKGDLVSVTRSFEYASLSAILDDDTIESTNDWQVLHEIMLSRDLKPILGDGSPNIVVTPEYLGQTYLDTVGLAMYFASTLTNDGWLPFGSGEGGGGAVSWNDVLSKPTEFPPSAHQHTLEDVPDLQTLVNGKASKPKVYTTPPNTAPDHFGQFAIDTTNKKTYSSEGGTIGDWVELAHVGHTHDIGDVDGLSEALNSKLESVPAEYLTSDEADLRYELIGENVPKTGTTDPTGVVPDFVGQIYVDTVAKESYVAMSIIGDWQSISMDELGSGGGSVDWLAITGKPDTFAPSTHSHPSTEITDFSTAVDGRIDTKLTTYDPPNPNWGEVGGTLANQTDLKTALDGKSDTTHLHTGTYYPANGGNINGSMTITNKGDMVQQIRFNTDRPWAFKQKGVDASAELLLTPDANTKIFRIASPLGTDALEVKVDDVGTNAYINAPNIKEGGANLSTKYSLSDHTHAYASLTEIPTTFTPPLATTSQTGGVKVGNGLRMGGTNNEWMTIRDGVGIKTNSVSLAVDVDKPTLDGWYAKSTQGLSIWKGTQTEYDALTPDSNTLYFITG